MGTNEDETTVTGNQEGNQPGERKPFLLVLSGAALGASRRLSTSPCILGRGSDVDLRLDDEGVSRHHAKIVTLSEGVLIIKDMDSTNGTYVNDRQVDVHPLEDGDRIRLGAFATLKFSFEDNIEANMRQHLFTAATRDALTGVHNKRSFDERLLHAVAFSKRHRVPLSIATFDVDHFKAVNDSYGHQFGDAVLRDIATRISATARLEDSVARVGGEEFVLILPGLDQEHALLAAERMRLVVAESNVGTPDRKIQVTISVGVVEFDPDRHQDAKALLAEADARLYEAKRAGRNRVIPEPPRRPPVFRDTQTISQGRKK